MGHCVRDPLAGFLIRTERIRPISVFCCTVCCPVVHDLHFATYPGCPLGEVLIQNTNVDLGEAHSHTKNYSELTFAHCSMTCFSDEQKTDSCKCGGTQNEVTRVVAAFHSQD